MASTLHALRPGNEISTFAEFWFSPRILDRFQILLPIVLAAIAWFWLTGHYTRRRPFWDELLETLRIVLLLALIDAAIQYMLKFPFSRFWFLGVWCGAIVCIPALRAVTKLVLLRLGLWQRQIVIIGTGENAIEAAAAVRSERLLGYEVAAFAALVYPVQSKATASPTEIHNVPVIAFDPSRPDELTQLDCPTIVIALDSVELEKHTNLVAQLNRSCNDVQVVPPVRGLPLYGARLHFFFRHELFFLVLGNNLSRRGPRLIKRSFDLAVSASLLILLSPLLATFVLWVRKDGGPAFFSNERISQKGVRFDCLKFRSMMLNADSVLEEFLVENPDAKEEWDRRFKLKDDPRVTPVGRILRAYSLDELPQLWNVLKGEMSLVGPRPICKEELELGRYGDDADNYLLTKPGMTGLWQVSGRSNTDYSERVFLDSWYAKNWSLWIDLVILFKTIGVVLRKDGAY